MNQDLYKIKAIQGYTVTRRMQANSKTDGGIYYAHEKDCNVGQVLNTKHKELAVNDYIAFYRTISATSLIVDKETEVVIIPDSDIFCVIEDVTNENDLQKIEVM